MRRSLTLLLLLVGAIGVFAQPFDPFQPASPIVMGRGGSFTATATGYNSFFYNPAGFARNPEFTLTSANIWAFADQGAVSLVTDQIGGLTGLLGGVVPSASSRAIDPAALEGLETYFTDLATWVTDTDSADLEAILIDATGDADIDLTSEADLAEIIATAGTDDVIAFLEAVEQSASDAGFPLPFAVDDLAAAVSAALPSGYVRIGAMIGMGFLGKGIGLGLFANVEAVIDGSNVLQATGTAFNTITFIGGFGLSFGNLHLGVSVRPTVLGYTDVAAAALVSDVFGAGGLELPIHYTTLFTEPVYFGSGLGIDAGAVYELGPLKFGFAIKDFLGTQIGYRSTSIDEYYQALLAASLPIGTELTADELSTVWTIPMKMNAGLEFHPNLGVTSYLFDPSVSVDLLDLSLALRLLRNGEAITFDRIIPMLNFGAEVNTLQFLNIRAGYYGGYLSAGFGIDMYVAEINGAVAGDFGPDETGAWSFGNVGLSFEVALRF